MVANIKIGDQLFERVQSYTVTEDSTPVSPADSTGGYGVFDFDTIGSPADRAMENEVVTLTDSLYGRTRAFLTDLESGGDDGLSVTATSRMSVMKASRQTQPYTGTLGQYFLYCLGLVGLDSGIVIDPRIASIPVTYPGWYGEVWHTLAKQLCPAVGAEIALVSGNIVIRPFREIEADRTRESSSSWSYAEGRLARAIEVYYYPTVYLNIGPAYPREVGDESIIDVPAGEVVEIEVDLPGASLVSVQQPMAVDFVSRGHEGSSIYSVIDKEGLPVLASDWLADGGSVELELFEDTTSMLIRVRGSSRVERGPFRIAVTDSDGTYSSLRVVGEGTFSEEHVVRLHSGVDPDRVTQEIGVTVQDPFITTRQDAFERGIWALKDYSSRRYLLGASAVGINRPGETGDQSLASFADFDEEYAGLATFGDFDDHWGPDATFGDFDEFWIEKVADEFENQAFGNVAGARILARGNYFRIRTATITPVGVSVDSEEDNTFGDFDAAWAGVATFGDFDELNEGKTFGDFDLEPLEL